MEKRFLTSVGQLSAEEYLLLFAPVYEELAASREPVILYGCGPLTELLFVRFDINKLNIIAVSDGSPVKWGSEFLNKKIIPPQEINLHGNASVLIISGSSQAEMKHSLENLLKPNFRLIPALQFHYFNATGEGEYWEKQWNQWKEPLKKAKNILCLLEGDTLDPFFLYGLTALKEKITVFAFSPYTYKGLKERGFQAADLQAQWKTFKEDFARKHDTVRKEGEAIGAINRSSLAAGLTFPGTDHKVFDAVFYDRLIFRLLQNTGLEEFVAQWAAGEAWDTFWYIGPFQEALSAVFAVQCRQRQIPTCLFYTGRGKNPLVEECLRELGTVVYQTGSFIEECEKGRLAGLLANLDTAPLERPKFSQNITLIPFMLSRRWETRELVRRTLENSPLCNDLVMIKCLEKVKHFNGVIGEADFCREYMSGLLGNEKPVIVIDSQVTDLEAVRLAHRILAVESCGITEIADFMGKKYEISS